jgi:hypothetical protein
MLLCSFTSVRALCLLRLRLDSPLSADSRWGPMFRCRCIAHAPRARRGVVSQPAPSPLNPLGQPSGQCAQARRDGLRAAGANSSDAYRLEVAVIALALSSCCVADVCHGGCSHPSVYFVPCAWMSCMCISRSLFPPLSQLLEATLLIRESSGSTNFRWLIPQKHSPSYY